MPAPRVSQPSNAPDSAPNPNRLKLVDYKKVFRAVVFTALAFLAACAPLIRQPVVDPTASPTPTSIPGREILGGDVRPDGSIYFNPNWPPPAA